MAAANLDSERLAELSHNAWKVRALSRIIGSTAVGCAVLDEDGRVFVGCNVEHRFRSHDIHAETAALAGLVSGGGSRPVAILIVAERERFTPCGACLDWIFELGGPECLVLTQRSADDEPLSYRAASLMPYYPR